MSGLYSHTTRADGTVLTAAIYNADHQNHITNFIPTQMDDYSNDATEMQQQSDPGTPGSESLAQSLSGELERIRYAIAQVSGQPYWYSVPSFASVKSPEYGAAGDGATDDATAIQLAITTVEAAGGGIVFFAEGTYAVESTLTITSSNVHLIGVGGATSIKYTGAATTDYLISIEAAANEGVSIRSMILRGGDFKLGKVKWVVYHAGNFGRGCLLRDVVLRDGLGIIYLEDCFYGRFDNVELKQTVPDPATQGWSNADWREVHWTDKAPIYLGSGGSGFQADRLTISKIGSEVHGADTAKMAVRIGVNAVINGMTFESSGADYDTYTIAVVDLLFVRGVVVFNAAQMEGNAASNSLVYQSYGASILINGMTMVNVGPVTNVFVNASSRELRVNSFNGSRINATNMSRITGVTGGQNKTTGIVYSQPNVATGERTTVTGHSAYTHNVYDSLNHQDPEGLKEANYPPGYPVGRIFPEKKPGTSLVVTNSSDGSGHYVQVTGDGMFLNQLGETVNLKTTVANESTVYVVYRLRPQTASKYWRVMIGRAANLYLDESAAAYTNWSGDWLAEFQTDGATAITNLVQNPRLAEADGVYNGANSRHVDSAVPGSGYWRAGDIIYDSTPTGGSTIGWVCVTAGNPGTWKAYGSIAT